MWLTKRQALTSIHLHTCIRQVTPVEDAEMTETSIHLHTCIRRGVLFYTQKQPNFNPLTHMYKTWSAMAW